MNKYRKKLQSRVVISPATITLCENKFSEMFLRKHESARRLSAEKKLEEAKAKTALDVSEHTVEVQGHNGRSSRRVGAAEGKKGFLPF